MVSERLNLVSSGPRRDVDLQGATRGEGVMASFGVAMVKRLDVDRKRIAIGGNKLLNQRMAMSVEQRRERDFERWAPLGLAPRIEIDEAVSAGIPNIWVLLYIK